jgi:hypothetical protein
MLLPNSVAFFLCDPIFHSIILLSKSESFSFIASSKHKCIQSKVNFPSLFHYLFVRLKVIGV